MSYSWYRSCTKADLKGQKMIDYQKYITLESGKRSGKPCIRGMRIAVQDVLEWLASGMTTEEIIFDFPELTREDILASLAYAANKEKHGTTIRVAA